MPSISEMRKARPVGFEPSNKPEKQAPPLPITTGRGDPNPFIRCPLPPFNAASDTLRQFDESGVVPTRRVIPLPVQTNSGVSTITNNSVVINQGGGGSSGGGTPLTTQVVTALTPLLNAGSAYSTTLTMSKSFQLIAMSANAPCEMRMYGKLTSQVSDATRPTDTPLAAELQHDLTTDIVLDTAPYTWTWQNRVGVNSDPTQDSHMYLTIINTGMVPSQIQTTVVFLPLEV